MNYRTITFKVSANATDRMQSTFIQDIDLTQFCEDKQGNILYTVQGEPTITAGGTSTIVYVTFLLKKSGEYIPLPSVK